LEKGKGLEFKSDIIFVIW